jgi:hypothetical protein
VIPNLLSEVEACKREHPEAWQHAHTGSARTEEFIRLLAARCHAISPRFGLNGKRGNPDDLSNDALCFKGEGPDHLADGTPATVIDVIGAAGTPGAVAQWAIVSKIDTPIKTAWIKPGDVPVRPSPPALPSYPGDAIFDEVGALLFADYAQAGRVPDPQAGRWFGRTIYDYLAGMTLENSIKKHRAEWRSALGL